MKASVVLDHYAVIGFPVAHSLSPFIHGMFAKQTKQHLQYRKLEIPPEHLHDDVLMFFSEGGRGLNVTLPHKQAVVPLCKFRTPRAEIAGAVNTIAVHESGDLIGDNTDGAGLIADLTKNLSFSLRDARILLLGAGGAARGVIAPLLGQNPATLHIANRVGSKAELLAQEFKTLGNVVGGDFDSATSDYHLIINATAASLQGIVPPIKSHTVSPDTICYDMAYGKGETPFTKWAIEHGAGRAELGWGMLVEQAAESFLLWRGVRPDTGPVLKAVRSPHPIALKSL